MERDLDNKSLLALCLVLLKQVQPYVSDFEEHENIFHHSMMQYSNEQSYMAANIDIVENPGRSMFNPDMSSISGVPFTKGDVYDSSQKRQTHVNSTQENTMIDNSSISMLIHQNKMQQNSTL